MSFRPVETKTGGEQESGFGTRAALSVRSSLADLLNI